MTNTLFNQILSYQKAPLSSLFASFSPSIQADAIRSFFDGQANDFLDDSASAHAALAYVQAHTKRIFLLSATTGEILMEIPATPTATETLSLYV